MPTSVWATDGRTGRTDDEEARMSDIAIEIEGLGKRYVIATAGRERYVALRDVLANEARRVVERLRRPFAREDAAPAPGQVGHWALRDLTMSVRRGERVGIIGRNGAGKSTLLKILSRITEPTEGRARVRGRMSSLLEVGTGFHPELTGRENVYLNGAILGMSRAEIRRSFDAIVGFSGVEKFLDTPVKRYSSGMRVRLAFAVAAHMDTEILVIDEVLAVGDAEFQKKCLGKMDEVSHAEGRTILFVSHDMSAISRLCGRVVCLEAGRAVLDTTDATRSGAAASEWRNAGGQFEGPWFTPLRFGLYGADGEPLSGPVGRGDEVWVEIEGVVESPDPALCVGYNLYSREGRLLWRSIQTDQIGTATEIPPLDGHVLLRTSLPVGIMMTGTYEVSLLASLYQREWIVRDRKDAPSVSLTVAGPVSCSPYASGDDRGGVLAFDGRWSMLRLDGAAVPRQG